MRIPDYTDATIAAGHAHHLMVRYAPQVCILILIRERLQAVSKLFTFTFYIYRLQSAARLNHSPLLVPGRLLPPGGGRLLPPGPATG